MKKKIFPIVLMVIGIGLIALGLISTNKILDKTKKPKKLEGYDIKETSTLTTCIDENCEYKMEDLYADISYDYDSDTLQKAIKELNENTQKYYKIAKESTIDASCQATNPSANQNSLRIKSDYNTYSDGKVITLNIKRTKINICTNEKESFQSENYVYDIEDDKMLSLEETKTKLNITNQDIHTAIKSANENFALEYNITITTREEYTDIKIYYNTAGDLYLSYYVDELKEYMQALLRERQS